MNYIIVVYFLFTLLYSVFKGNNTYLSFTNGVKDGLKIVINMMSIVIIFNLCIKSFEYSGLFDYISNAFNNTGLINLLIQMLVRPMSSGSSYTILMSIYDKYGVNSFYSSVSTMIHSSCDTLFYIVTLYSSYFKSINNNKAMIYGVVVIIFNYLLIMILSILFL